MAADEFTMLHHSINLGVPAHCLGWPESDEKLATISTWTPSTDLQLCYDVAQPICNDRGRIEIIDFQKRRVLQKKICFK